MYEGTDPPTTVGIRTANFLIRREVGAMSAGVGSSAPVLVRACTGPRSCRLVPSSYAPSVRDSVRGQPGGASPYTPVPLRTTEPKSWRGTNSEFVRQEVGATHVATLHVCPDRGTGPETYRCQDA